MVCSANDRFLELVQSRTGQNFSHYKSSEKCDVVLEEKMYVSCYSINRSSPVYGVVKIDTTNTNVTNIVKRPNFKFDKRVPKPNNLKLYSSFDRGHTLVSDASFDYNQDVLNSTYLMSNITPQYRKTNRYSYARVEAHERLLSKSVKELFVFVRVDFGNVDNIPTGYYRHYFNNSGLNECFYTLNDNVIRTLEDQRAACDD